MKDKVNKEDAMNTTLNNIQHQLLINLVKERNLHKEYNREHTKIINKINDLIKQMK